MINADRMRLDGQRRKAAQYFVENFSREERYLIVFARDFETYLSAFSADNFKSEEKREGLRWDFFFSFQSLRKRMAEYSWGKDFLNSHGIDFRAVRKLFFALFTAEEISRWS